MIHEKGKSPEALHVEHQVNEWEWGGKVEENSNLIQNFPSRFLGKAIKTGAS